ncbi:MAG: tetratricopeptide repeat protein, partial [Lactobacillus crispatus]|nr:tetratricopeptide repeat protein [Lactobacillus crispatus]MCT7715019.1 tetratricopeptide repeat protein [Lactobacillus crispatus]
DERKGDLEAAIQNLEEALREEHSLDVILKLCKLYCANKQEDQAYALIKEEPDLFSDQRVFKSYCQILAKNNFFIEALQLKNLVGVDLSEKVKPASEEKQRQIMQNFKQREQVTQSDYESLHKLNLPNFKAFARSVLLDPTPDFAVRLSLCEDLVRLGLEEKFEIWVIGQMESFIPANTLLLEKEPKYREIISSIGSKFHNSPSQLPLMLGEVNLVLGSLYPKINQYIDEPDSFASDLVSFLQRKDGRSHQKLLEKIYKYLPQ